MDRIVAAKLDSPLDRHGLPVTSAWADAQPIEFCHDWQAENPDPERQTEVRLLWSFDHLFLRFHCRYRGLFVCDGSNTRRDKLWMWDVAEVFIRPGTWEPNHYLEFEISPNGDWLDLDISPGKKSILFCDMVSRVVLDHDWHIWTAEMAIPMHILTQSFDPSETWRLNFFRIEGCEPGRFYSAWIPTHTPRPNFHAPDVFGLLHFRH